MPTPRASRPPFARGLYRMMVHLGRGENQEAAEALAALSLTPLPAARLAAFTRDFTALYQDFADKPAAEVSLTRQMMRTVKAAVRAGMTFPGGAFPLIKSLMYLDGMVVRCAPQALLLRDVARFEGDFAE